MIINLISLKLNNNKSLKKNKTTALGLRGDVFMPSFKATPVELKQEAQNLAQKFILSKAKVPQKTFYD